MPLLQLDLRAANQHLVGVCLSHTPSHPTLRLSLPSWTPGSYLIRDYVRQLEGLGACWLWSGPAGGRVRETEVYLEHRRGSTLLYRWFGPPVEIKLTFDADGRLLHGAADRMKMRM